MIDRGIDRALKLLRWPAWVGVVFFAVVFVIDSPFAKSVAVAVVSLLVIMNLLGCYRMRLLRYWPARLEWIGAAVAGIAVTVAPTASPAGVTLVATGNGIIGLSLVAALLVGVRANGERLRDRRIWMEAGAVVCAVSAWFVVSYGGSGTASGSVPLGFGRPEFSVGPVSLVFVLVLTPSILLLARLRPSRGPVLHVAGYCLISVSLLGLNARVGVDSTAGLIRPVALVLVAGVACVILSDTEPSLVRLMDGSAPWRPVRSWARTAWLLVTPAMVIGGVALAARSWTEVLWPVLLVVAIGLLAVQARMTAESQIARRNSALGRQEPPPLDLADLTDWCQSVETSSAAGLRYAVIAVIPEAGVEVRSVREPGLPAEIERETVRRLRGVMRTERRIAGTGRADWAVGVDRDRFLVLVVGPAEADAGTDALARAGASVDSWLAMPFRTDRITVRIGFGIGYAERVVPAGEDPAALIQDAVWAAQNGDGRHPRAFDPDLRTATLRRAQLSALLEDALVDASGLSLVYEPLVNLRSGETIGAESLARWNPPGWGSISPGEFIPLAESGTAMLDLGEWVMRTACRAAAGTGGRALIGVNLSGVEVAHPDLYPRVMRILDDTALDPARLTIEITETVVGATVRDAAPALGRLVAAGVRLSMDDFGTQSSGLLRVLALPWHSIKLDRTLVVGIESAESPRAALVRSIVGVADELGATIVAEGVEDVRTLELMAALGCHIAQGWVFGRGRALLAEAWAEQRPVGWRVRSEPATPA